MAKKPFPFSVCEECCVAGGGGGGGGEISIDTKMSDTSENAVQNKVIKKYVDEGLDKKASLEDVLNSDSYKKMSEEVNNMILEIDGLWNTVDNIGSDITMIYSMIEDNAGQIRILQNQIGDIETALDNIIEIQNSLIGGDA